MRIIKLVVRKSVLHPETNAEFSDSPFFKSFCLTGRVHQGVPFRRFHDAGAPGIFSLSYEVMMSAGLSGQSLVVPHIEGLPFEKRLALDTFLQGFVRGQNCRVDFSPIEQ